MDFWSGCLYKKDASLRISGCLSSRRLNNIRKMLYFIKKGGKYLSRCKTILLTITLPIQDNYLLTSLSYLYLSPPTKVT